MTSWHKSSYSNGTGGNCVEVADVPGGTVVRDSKYPEHGYLPFSVPEWVALLRSTRS
ncbi:DUF397 domain-containing protein [Nocardiopsis sp. NPDC006938]|uniref:DUF397 domain-containing protein n=1 Tax=Nocardiopsis sp. NPDC006938 TaxID=3364337 RepID=UPI0036CBD5DE